jgi:hypothetical protein
MCMDSGIQLLYNDRWSLYQLFVFSET